LHDADGTVIDRAMAAANGGKVRRLWAGDLSDYDGDESRADAALLACLAYYTRDAEQLDRLSRASGLFRPKWDRPDGTFGTYGRRTITKALDLRPAEFVRGRVGAELRDEQGARVSARWRDVPRTGVPARSRRRATARVPRRAPHRRR
jgi:primase-polymerase (primpol)-like protein